MNNEPIRCGDCGEPINDCECDHGDYSPEEQRAGGADDDEDEDEDEDED